MNKRQAMTMSGALLLLMGSACTRKPAEAPAPASAIIRLDAALDDLVSTTTPIEKIAGGHEITEGPVYVPEGYLLFSDIPKNTIFKWTPGVGESVFRKPSGYDGTDATPPGAVIGSNGLTLDRQGRLIICEHGNRRVTRFDKRDGTLTVLAERYDGKRLNSPNDVIVKSDGAIYFTDPPYGFTKQDDDPKKELKFNGLYRLVGTKLELLTAELSRPNGLTFSPDEKFLYVANSDPARKIWMRYPVKDDGTLGTGTVFQDVTSDNRDGLPDGMKVDKKGNLYCSSPGGIRIFSPDGKHIGSITLPEVPHNCAWGKYGTDAKSAVLGPNEEADTLYITARPSVYRIRMKVAGVRPL
ncbi:MAG: SMP-30/gluconolactonase/LRE family protein [Bryobacteraceae bacterium]